MPATAEILPQPAIRASVPLPQGAIDLQLDTASGQSCLRLAGPSRISRSGCRFQNARAFRRALQPGQRIFHAFVVHGKLLHPGAIMEAEIARFHGPPCARRRRRGRAPPCNFNPMVRTNSHAGNRSSAQKHCAAQAEYDRLAAQAYSPSDAMSQACSWSGLRPKGSMAVRDEYAERFAR
jgi:hypothetical protein